MQNPKKTEIGRNPRLMQMPRTVFVKPTQKKQYAKIEISYKYANNNESRNLTKNNGK